MTDKDIIKAIDILCKFDFFGGQRAGRELWAEKPIDIQDKDIENFSKDVAFLKDFINRQQTEIADEKAKKVICADVIHHQKEEIERLKAEKDSLIKTYSECQVDNLQEYAHRLENKLSNNMDISMVGYQSVIDDIEQTYKEMVGEG